MLRKNGTPEDLRSSGLGIPLCEQWTGVRTLIKNLNTGVYFGLLAPRAKGKMWPGLFVVLNQPQRSRPRRLSWRSSMRKYFGVDPHMSGGEEMQWIRREKVVAR